MNAVGLRDQRIRLYVRRDAGSDGMVKTVFQFDHERWGRLDESRASVSTMQGRLQMKLDAIVEFADEVVVPNNGVAVVGNRAWWIRGINPVRQTRRVIVGLERIDDEAFTTFKVFDGNSTLDGTHLVNP